MAFSRPSCDFLRFFLTQLFAHFFLSFPCISHPDVQEAEESHGPSPAEQEAGEVDVVLAVGRVDPQGRRGHERTDGAGGIAGGGVGRAGGGSQHFQLEKPVRGERERGGCHRGYRLQGKSSQV